ncbi:MAG: copper homeostasis protein CutC [Lactimicrobium massiliense]|nr:copper homeostasis protein CutC [Lactimicrobium massiliense]MDD6229929.1 copper homeostasis protein CutC [Lactimicrobium massiliense]
MIDKFQIEICAGSLSDLLTADAFDEVDRVEFNSALELGGLTPSYGSFLQAREKSKKRIICMVRPRAAGFVYNEDEKNTMFRDAQLFLDAGADGIVFGFLNPDHTVDEETTAKMVSLIHGYGKEAVFHKAFDETPDPFQAAQTLINLGVQRILTSGQKADVIAGIHLLTKLQNAYGSQIEILPGGGVKADNIVALLDTTGCMQFHMSAKETRNDSGSYPAVSADNIRKVLVNLQAALHQENTLTREDQDMLRNDSFENIDWNDEDERP